MKIKRMSVLSGLLGVLSILSGYLMARASFIGRLGMTYVYREYGFLKTWWKGALAVFFVWMIVLIIQALVDRKGSRTWATIVPVVFIVAALAGLYLTYSDFQHTTTHRWLKEKFHIGAYLFWLGWIIISLFSLVERRQKFTAA